MGANMRDRNILLLYSGGRDSTLAALKLLEEGFKVKAITFVAPYIVGEKNICTTINRIKSSYNRSFVFLGFMDISGVMREYIKHYYNLTPKLIEEEFGELSPSQVNCLSCRMAMYTMAIILARQMKIKRIAEGARYSQGFVVQLPEFFNVLNEILNTYGLELVLPVYNIEDDQLLKSYLLMRGFIPKSYEMQCLLGIPLPKTRCSNTDRCPPPEEVEAALRYLKKIITPKLKIIVSQNPLIRQKGRELRLMECKLS